MNFEIWGIEGKFYMDFPLRWSGYVLLGFYILCLVLLFIRHARQLVPEKSASQWKYSLFIGLGIAAPFLAELFVVQVSAPIGVSLADPRLSSFLPAFSLLGAVPWMLAGGFLGIPQAMIIGLISGLARGGWQTHQILTPLNTALLAGCIAWLLRQDYIEWPAKAARHPVVSGLVMGVLFGTLRTFDNYAYTPGTLYDGMDLAILLWIPITVSVALEAVLAGTLGEWTRVAFPNYWVQPTSLRQGPYNRSLVARLITSFAVLGLIASGLILYGDWAFARSASRDFIEEQMMQTAEQAGDSIPLFIQTSRSSIRELADGLGGDNFGQLSLDSSSLQPILDRRPFFNRLAVFTTEGELIATAPPDDFIAAAMPLEVEAGLTVALDGIPQEVITQSVDGSPGAEFVLFAPVYSSDGTQVLGAVLGWTDLATNSALLPAITRMNDFSLGEAYITDAQGRILLHPDPSRILQQVDVSVTQDAGVQERTSPNGTRWLVYTYQVEGYPWNLVITAPQQVIGEFALDLTMRLFAVLLVVGTLMLLMVFITSRRLTKPLESMASTAESIAHGNLSQPVAEAGDDEIGRLATSFERMRLGLKSRLNELSLLLLASQEMASSFELRQVLPSILGGVQELYDSETVRLVMEEDSYPLVVYHSGDDHPDWQLLDEQVMEICRARGSFILENPSRAKALLDLRHLSAAIGALIAVPLNHEEKYIGVLWLGYRDPHTFTSDEKNLLSILAGQLGVSVSNAQLFHEIEKERVRLTAILQATPDAVIVTDRRGRILLANPAAESVLQRSAIDAIGAPAIEMVTSPELVDLLISPKLERLSTEINLDDGRVFFALLSEVKDTGRDKIGRVCVLSDITHYKKLDALKTEFVSTVSHDLRSPLTLMGGYATMLSMVGDMNDEQKGFTRKILSSVDQMSNLVENLLDLGRIEAGTAIEPELLDLGQVIKEVVNSYSPQAKNKRIDIEVEIQETLQPIEADPTLLQQAMGNLVDNAIKFTDGGGTVTISVLQTTEKTYIQIDDTGIGIAPADQARLFEKFFRAHKQTTEDEKGSGLGLAIVKSIIEQHGGRVVVESKLGKGTTFTLELPNVQGR